MRHLTQQMQATVYKSKVITILQQSAHLQRLSDYILTELKLKFPSHLAPSRIVITQEST